MNSKSDRSIATDGLIYIQLPWVCSPTHVGVDTSQSPARPIIDFCAVKEVDTVSFGTRHLNTFRPIWPPQNTLLNTEFEVIEYP